MNVHPERIMMRPYRLLPCVLLAFSHAACGGVSVQQRMADDLPALRAAGFRVAVMPFRSSAPAEGFLESSLAPVGQLLSLEVGGEGLPARQGVAALMRRDIITWLSLGSFEVVEPWVSDTQLAHRGLDPARLGDRRHAAEVARILGVDGLVYGDVSRWNRSYYVLQSTAEVALQLELVEGTSGRSLFWTERSESLGSGLTGGPTGFVSAATEPLAGLRASQLQELTRSVVRHAAIDLNGGEVGVAAGGELAPRLSFVALARPHEGAFAAGERVEVIAVGTPDCDVRFDLGRLRTGVPMRQVARHPDPRGERATYIGSYVVQPADAAAGLPLHCGIRRQRQGRAVQSRYRWDGTVTLGAR